MISPTLSPSSSSSAATAEPDAFLASLSAFFVFLPILQYAHSTARFDIIFLPGLVNTRKDPPARIIINRNINIFTKTFAFFFFFLLLFLSVILCSSSFCFSSISSFTCSASELLISFKKSSSLLILIFLYCTTKNTRFII